MSADSVVHDVLAERAARWYARLGAPDCSDAERAAFESWLAQDAAHRDAWNTVERAALRADMVAADPALRAMIDEALERPARAPGRRTWAAAAALALVFGGAGTYALRHRDNPGEQVALQDYATRAGETRPVALADGSRVVMDGQSAIRVGLGSARRDVELVRGQALFRVARDAQRPFVVSARGYTVTALGTYFDVDLASGDGVDVALVEGKVRVERIGGGESWVLTPGMRLALHDGRAVVSQDKAQLATGWAEGALHFDATPLADVVLQMNRHSDHRLVLDPRLSARTFSGVIRIDGADGEKALVEALEAYGIARVGRSGGSSTGGETLLVPY